jgi:hypothetical protein
MASSGPIPATCSIKRLATATASGPAESQRGYLPFASRRELCRRTTAWTSPIRCASRAVEPVPGQEEIARLPRPDRPQDIREE